MRGPVTPSSAAAEQAAAEGLLALASLPQAGRSQDLVPSPGTVTEQAAAVPAELPAAEPPSKEAPDQPPSAGATAWVGVPTLHGAGQ